MNRPFLIPNRETTTLAARAMRALGMTHRELGEALGASERTSQRWLSGRSSLTVPALQKMAVLTYARDAALAAEIAAAASETLASLGLVTSPPAEPPAKREPFVSDPAVLVDLVVCVAADALSLPPNAVRGALLAAFGRARELGLGVDDVERALATRIGPNKPT